MALPLLLLLIRRHGALKLPWALVPKRRYFEEVVMLQMWYRVTRMSCYRFLVPWQRMPCYIFGTVWPGCHATCVDDEQQVIWIRNSRDRNAIPSGSPEKTFSTPQRTFLTLNPHNYWYSIVNAIIALCVVYVCSCFCEVFLAIVYALFMYLY